MATTNTVYRKHIARGMNLLEQKEPQWIERINVERLDINSYFDCVLGQVFGEFDEGVIKLELDLAGTANKTATSWSHGFRPILLEDGQRLTNLWVETINAKRNPSLAQLTEEITGEEV